jgi:hypothetical protein
MELEHGWNALQRRRYLDEIFAVIPVESFTRDMGSLAAEIDAATKDRTRYCTRRSSDWGDRFVPRLRGGNQ